MCPVDQVKRFHQYNGAIVTPSVLRDRTLPISVAITCTFTKYMQIGHHKIKSPIRSTSDMWIANPFLFGQLSAKQYRLSTINVSKRVTIGANGKIGRLALIFKINQQIPG